MIVYRVGKLKFARDLTGEGARLNGGRWNHKFVPCVYTSENRALAILEYTVNVNIDDIPRALSISTIEMPDTGIYEFEPADLPGNWRDSPAPSSTKDFGSRHLIQAKILVLKVPSIVIPNEFNYILNPIHPDSRNFKVLAIQDLVYDVRIKMR